MLIIKFHDFNEDKKINLHNQKKVFYLIIKFMGWGIFGRIKKSLKRIMPTIKTAIQKAKEYLPSIKKTYESTKPYLEKIEFDNFKPKKILDTADSLFENAPNYLDKADNFVNKIRFDDDYNEGDSIEYDGRTFIPKLRN